MYISTLQGSHELIYSFRVLVNLCLVKLQGSYELIIGEHLDILGLFNSSNHMVPLNQLTSLNLFTTV
ncbi:hypothetical protein HanPSC8_Chr17g0776161 [Helianthus annuus]|nr:hypothetical protein HanPSC8_Chr17g0776161 [Helianthus annuus]